MKASRIVFILVFILFPFTGSLAQKGTFEQADKEYSLFRYKSAISYYLKGLKTDSLNQEAIERLAKSYYNVKDYKNAEVWYAKASALNPAPENNLHYAEVLANNGKYGTSAVWYQKYLLLNNNDNRASMLAKAYTNVSEFYADSAKWKVRMASLNTGFDEFSPVFFKQGIMFTSNRSFSTVKTLSGWDMKPFTNLFYVSDTSKIAALDIREVLSDSEIAALNGPAVATSINDNRTIGDFNIRSLNSIKEYDFKGQFTQAKRLEGLLRSKLNDGPVSFPADETWMMFTRNTISDKGKQLSSDRVNKLHLFSIRYTGKKWSKIEAFPYNSTEYSTGHPALSADGNTLYFVSDMPGGYGGKDLYYSVRTGGTWSKPVNLGNKVNTEGDEMFPFLDRHNNLYFSSTGLPGIGGLDIFYTPVKNYLPTELPKNLGYPVNSNKDDFGITIAFDELNGYFSSNRNGNDDIYRFDLAPPAKEASDVLAKAVTEPAKLAPVEVVNQVAVNTTQEPAKAISTPPAQEQLTRINEPVTDTVKRTEPSNNIRPSNNASPSNPISRNQAPSNANTRPAPGAAPAVKDTSIAGGRYILKWYNESGNAMQSQGNNMDQTRLLALHGTAPLETILTITNPLNGKTVYAKVVGNFPQSNDGVVVGLTKEVIDKIGATGTRFPVIVNYNRWLFETEHGIASQVGIGSGQFSQPLGLVQGSSATAQPPATAQQQQARTTTQPPATAQQQPARTTTQPPATTQQQAARTNLEPGRQTPPASLSPATVSNVDAARNQVPSSPSSSQTQAQPRSVVQTAGNNVYVAPFTVSIPENSLIATTLGASDADAGTTFSYSLSGGSDASKFRINNSTGALAFIYPPDFERPNDADGNNTYGVRVRVSDGINSSEQTLTIIVTDINDNSPVIASKSDISISENTVNVASIKAADADAGTSFTYSLINGSDADKFNINSSTGALSFISSPDFENPVDFDSNNIYVVGVRVSDGINGADQTLRVTVTNINDSSPVITSRNALSVTENTSFVDNVTATDSDAGTNFSYTLSGGPDISRFRINSSTGLLNFVSPPDFENPADADANNSYTVIVRASDGKNTSDRTLTINVADANDNKPVFTSGTSFSISENSASAAGITATDADAGTMLNYSLSGGADVAKFRINTSSGALTFITPPDFERAGDADVNNMYVVGVRVTDGINITEETIRVTVSDINDNSPVIVSNPDFSVHENTTAVTTVKATDADAGTTFTYSLNGGADVSKFRINSSNGTLSFIAPPDFENPGDADSNNMYTVILRVSDGTNITDQTVTITVTDVNDNAPVIRLAQ